MQFRLAQQARLLRPSFAAAVCATILVAATPAAAQRRLGIDISAFQGNLSAADWTTLHTTNSRDFVFIRSSRGGTTGFDHHQTDSSSVSEVPANCNGVSTTECLANRYDDPYFGQNITRATNAGLFAGPYHRIQAQIIASTPNSGGIANSGTDEANHMMQMSGAWMRPGYILPMFDFEDGNPQRTPSELAQFALDFSNRIYQVMQVRPTMYANGTYANTVLGAATQTQRDQLAKPATNGPTMTSPAFPFLVTARYPAGSGNQYTGNVQTEVPSDTVSSVYGIWDDYGDSQPWTVWQYSSGERLSGYSTTSPIDADVLNGGMELLKDMLVPAVWWNDSSGDWGTMTNWNSGQPLHTYDTTKTFDNQTQQGPYIPPVFPNMSPVVGSTTLPVPRLPGTAGSGPTVTSGVNDTVILERPSANITVTLSTGSYDIRKLYMRETLNITGGSLTINYDPTVDSSSTPISAQFSGPVSLGGSGSLSVNTLQIDASKTFTLAGSTGTLTFKQINLLSSAKIAVTGDVNINPLSNSAATISGGSGNVDLSGGTRAFAIGNGSSDVDLDVVSPMINGGLTKNGAGTMRLTGANTFTGPVTVNAGVLRSNNAAGFSSSSAITVNGGTLEMNGVTDTVASLAGSGGAITQGAAGLTLAATSGSTTFAGTITGAGTLTKNGGSTQILSGNNSLGPVALSAGSLLFNGSNTTGAVTVSGGTLGGTGSVSGAVTVGGTGHLAPGASIESIGVGALTLNAGSVLDIELAAPGTSDLINISGALTLNGGSVNLFDAGGLDAGTYTLATFASVVGSEANLSTPTGPSSFNYKLVALANSLSLLVSIPGDFDLDGMVDGNDYAVWRKSDGTQGNYDLWRANYGRAAGSGSGAGLGGTASIPEPAAILLAVCAALPFMNRRIRRRD